MFTGIIEEIGEVKIISRRGTVVLFQIKAVVVSEELRKGDSISVNGTCVTVIENQSGILHFEVMPETLNHTNLGSLKIGDKVNLERALKIGERISGHFVTGHIDCAGLIRRKHFLNGNLCFEVSVPEKFMNNLVTKGSVAVDGVSLTVVNKRSNTFNVYIIPHTINNTTLKFKGPSDKVNIEFDILTKKSN